jgi:two-component system, chemotaxis family, chemotaxis protein CheY
MRALVVDDSRVMRSILRRILEGYGFEVTEAVTGSDGLVKLRAMSTPDVALVDWNMPELTGIEFVEQVREDVAYDSMAIMMVTTETELTQMERALAAGANEYLMKPFSAEALKDKLALLGFYEASV